VDVQRFAAWRARWFGKSPAAPALLIAALAAGAAWSGARGILRTIALPFWSAAPALAAGDPDSLPRLRSDATTRAHPANAAWPGVFLILVAEAARAGLQEVDRLQRAAAAGAVQTQGIDPRGRLADAIDFVLREPAVTAKSLARYLRITPQAALRLLHALAKAGVVRETTGRRSFRAFAV
jgi:HTH DNA binding domain